ncbi:MAG TPA: hypothetical protein VH597_01480 [Verrucomicrobiae bacterium]|jgi:hypothetical protein|nr:hypothetical protein [Verrucomicrobiae bacterium]
MKQLIIVLAALASLTASAQIGVDAIAKQRARDAANQPNARNMQPSGGAPAPATGTPAVTPAPLSPGQQAYAGFQSQFFAMNTNSSPADKQDLAQSLGKVAQGANKPSAATLSKLSDNLTTAAGEAKLTTPKKTRVAQDVAVLLNSANAPIAQKQAMIKDVQTILESGGASSENSAAVATDLQTVVDEVKPK